MAVHFSHFQCVAQYEDSARPLNRKLFQHLKDSKRHQKLHLTTISFVQQTWVFFLRNFRLFFTNYTHTIIYTAARTGLSGSNLKRKQYRVTTGLQLSFVCCIQWAKLRNFLIAPHTKKVQMFCTELSIYLKLFSSQHLKNKLNSFGISNHFQKHRLVSKCPA